MQTLDQLYSLRRVFEDSWEFAKPVHMCFVDLREGIRPCLWQGCPLSLVLFIVFMDSISMCSQGPEGVWFGSRWISFLLFTVCVVLLAPLNQDLQHVLGQFAAKCEAAGMRISTSMSESLVLYRKKVACSLRVGGEFLPQVVLIHE